MAIKMYMIPAKARSSNLQNERAKGRVVIGGIDGGGYVVPEGNLVIVDDLITQDPNKALSAKQGYVLRGLINGINEDLIESAEGLFDQIEGIILDAENQINDLLNNVDGRIDDLLVEVSDTNDIANETLIMMNNTMSDIELALKIINGEDVPGFI